MIALFLIHDLRNNKQLKLQAASKGLNLLWPAMVCWPLATPADCRLHTPDQ